MNQKALGRRINAARREKGITGERLAEGCCISATYLRQIESGAKIPSLPVFVSLCREVGVSPNYLLYDSGLIKCEYDQGMYALALLYAKATPQQIRIVTAMVRSVLEILDN